MSASVITSRRRMLAGGGALVVSFSLGSAFAQDQAAPAPAPPPGPPPSPPPGSLKGAPYLDSWIRIDADGSITVFTGKAELGQGFKTACQQIAAEELDVPFASLKLITADTSRTANEGYTSGSNSMKDSGTAVQHAAAQVRALLIAEAARRLELPAESLKTDNGAVIAPDGRRLGYGDLVAGEMLHVQAEAKSKLKDPADYRIMGQPFQRVDIPAKVTGGAAYVQDMRLPGMVHARVVRPPGYGAELTALRFRRGREDAWRRQDRARRQLPRRRRGRGIPGGQGDAGAVVIGEMAGDRAAAEAGQSAGSIDRPAVAGRNHLPAEQSAPRQAHGRSRRCIRGPIRRTARSGPLAPWRNRSTAP